MAGWYPPMADKGNAERSRNDDKIERRSCPLNVSEYQRDRYHRSVVEMTPAQSRKLKIGQRVSWKKKDSQGTIVLVNSSFVQIKWDSGKISYHRHDNMQDTTLVK
jgi:hypothetical protein